MPSKRIINIYKCSSEYTQIKYKTQCVNRNVSAEKERGRERESERGSEAQLAIIPWNSIKIAKRAGAAQNQHRWSQTKSESESAWSAAKTRTNKPAKRSLVSSFPSGHSLSFTLALSLSCFLWLPLGLSLFISLQLSTAFLCLRSSRQWNSLSSFSIGSRTIWATNLWRTPKLARRWPRHWHPFLERDPLMSKFLMCHTAQVSPGPRARPAAVPCRAVQQQHPWSLDAIVCR